MTNSLGQKIIKKIKLIIKIIITYLVLNQATEQLELKP